VGHGVLRRDAAVHQGGVYLNFELDQGEAVVRRGYTPQTYARLVALKDKWDPGNLFRVNQNIAPSQSAEH